MHGLQVQARVAVAGEFWGADFCVEQPHEDMVNSLVVKASCCDHPWSRRADGERERLLHQYNNENDVRRLFQVAPVDFRGVISDPFVVVLVQ